MSATKKNVESKYDIDNVVPLLLAALGNPAINYKTMEAMDELSRTEYAWQHRFRVWKAKAKEIAEKNPDHAPPMTGTPTKKRTPASKSKATVADNGKAAALNNDDDEAGVVKKEVDDSAITFTNPFAEPPTSPTKPPTAKKRASSSEATSDPNTSSPTKKAKVTKKGRATVVKKPTKKPRVSLESIDEDESGSGEESEGESPAKEKGAAKAKAKGRGKGAAKENKSPVKKGKGGVKAQAGAEADAEGVVDEEMEGMTDMQFEQEV